ncbi:unnamed protein product [Prorocentrum cordatum]|uniref:Uncharacterized protein n=1 Tax=Prorocentrum cordatum TaxID=2364126 RepID=A0ABN9R4N8_9DINO|nr:unnamed protein product [Polarella glacialis]|mmetsp:Transcript_12859/g.34069  ORF Transcript_12859/g.34069 Transcript_12859/m.34069 type:complete len:116 (+) Transcript_12859:61-408(+)
MFVQEAQEAETDTGKEQEQRIDMQYEQVQEQERANAEDPVGTESKVKRGPEQAQHKLLVLRCAVPVSDLHPTGMTLGKTRIIRTRWSCHRKSELELRKLNTDSDAHLLSPTCRAS